MQSVTGAVETTKRPPTSRQIVGTALWVAIIWPACKLAQLEGWWIDRQNRHLHGVGE